MLREVFLIFLLQRIWAEKNSAMSKMKVNLCFGVTASLSPSFLCVSSLFAQLSPFHGYPIFFQNIQRRRSTLQMDCFVKFADCCAFMRNMDCKEPSKEIAKI